MVAILPIQSFASNKFGCTPSVLYRLKLQYSSVPPFLLDVFRMSRSNLGDFSVDWFISWMKVFKRYNWFWSVWSSSLKMSGFLWPWDLFQRWIEYGGISKKMIFEFGFILVMSSLLVRWIFFLDIWRLNRFGSQERCIW